MENRPVQLFALAASLRRESLNHKLLLVAAGHARAAGASVDLASFRDFDLPVYGADLEAASGLPAGARALVDRILAADGLLFASPEYNNSVAGPAKNAVDWVSRARPNPVKGRSCLLLSASPGMVGGNRGLWQLRVPLEVQGMHVHPDMFSLAAADKAFSPEGALADARTDVRLRAVVQGYLAAAGALAAARKA